MSITSQVDRAHDNLTRLSVDALYTVLNELGTRQTFQLIREIIQESAIKTNVPTQTLENAGIEMIRQGKELKRAANTSKRATNRVRKAKREQDAQEWRDKHGTINLIVLDE